MPQKAATKTKMMSRTRDMSAKCAQPAHAHKRERARDTYTPTLTHSTRMGHNGPVVIFGRLVAFIFTYMQLIIMSLPQLMCVCVCAGTSHASCYGNTPIICSGASNNAPVAVISGLGAIDKSNDNFQFPSPNASKDSQTKAQRHTRPVSLSLTLPSTLFCSLLHFLQSPLSCSFCVLVECV